MCENCAKHAGKAWYLDEKNHKMSMSLRERILSYKMVKIADASARFMFFRKRDFTRLEYIIYNLFSKYVHGGQIVPRVEQSLEIVDLAHDLAVTYCICKRAASGGKDEDYKCIYLNASAKQARKAYPGKIQFASKDEVKELILRKRSQGAFQTVLWGPNPNIASLCNCYNTCGVFQIPGVKTAFIPSAFQAKIIDKKKCTTCGICCDYCYFNAIEVTETGCEINPLKCSGCGLCVDNCPSKVLGFEPRTEFYDPVRRKWAGKMEKKFVKNLFTKADRKEKRIQLKKEYPDLRLQR